MAMVLGLCEIYDEKTLLIICYSDLKISNKVNIDIPLILNRVFIG